MKRDFKCTNCHHEFIVTDNKKRFVACPLCGDQSRYDWSKCNPHVIIKGESLGSTKRKW